MTVATFQRAAPARYCQCETLRAEVDELRETIRQLRQARKPKVPLPKFLGIRTYQERMLLMLLERAPHVVSQEELYHELYGDRIDGGPDAKIIIVNMCKMRPKLRPYGIDVTANYGGGYYLTLESAEKLRGMIMTEGSDR
jgi:Transcriptional regulatory protein, C terminal